MRLLYCGDVVGRSGRQAVLDALPDLRRRLELDFVVANGENSAHGFGITPKICEEFLAGGVDVVTLGNHAWDQREILSYIDQEPRLLRPANMPWARCSCRTTRPGARRSRRFTRSRRRSRA